jgi:hypothetical protein
VAFRNRQRVTLLTRVTPISPGSVTTGSQNEKKYSGQLYLAHGVFNVLAPLALHGLLIGGVEGVLLLFFLVLLFLCLPLLLLLRLVAQDGGSLEPRKCPCLLKSNNPTGGQYSIGHKKKAPWRKECPFFSAILSGDSKCCLSCLSCSITFTKELPN